MSDRLMICQHRREAFRPRNSTRAQNSKRRRPKVQASQGNAVLLQLMGGLNHPDLSTKTGEECLPRSEDSDVDIDELSGD